MHGGGDLLGGPSASGHAEPTGPVAEPAQPPSALGGTASATPRPTAYTFDDLPDGVLVLDTLGVIQHMNVALGFLLERDPGSTVGWPFQQVVAEEDAPGAMALLSVLRARRLRDVHLTFSTPSGGRRQ